MLHNEVYIGTWYYGKRNNRAKTHNPREHWIAVEVPPIVDKGIWHKAQLQSKNNTIMSGRNNKYRYLMRFCVSCKKCGYSVSALTAESDGKVYPYYTCQGRTNAQLAKRFKCDLPYFSARFVDDVVWEWIRDNLLDPDNLAAGLKAYREERDKLNAPFIYRLSAIQTLLSENREKLDKLLDLYLNGAFSRESLLNRKEELTKIVESLESEERDLLERINQGALTDETIQEIARFIDGINRGLDAVRRNADFETRRRFIDWLDIKGYLAVEDGERVIYVNCILTAETLRIVLTNSGNSRL